MAYTRSMDKARKSRCGYPGGVKRESVVRWLYPNRYAGTCDNCGRQVKAARGGIKQTDQGWRTVC